MAGDRLRWHRCWSGLGLALVAAIVYLSLTPAPPAAAVPGLDKLGHALAYAVLAAWYRQIYFPSALPIALACIALGTLLEAVQPLTGARYFEWLDLAANAGGTLLGIAATRGAGGELLRRLESRLG